MKKQFVIKALLSLFVCFILMTCASSAQSSGSTGPEEIDLNEIIKAGGDEFTGNSHGNQRLFESPYGYEIWSNSGRNNRVIWYGPEVKGGAAFRAEWNYPDDFLARIGYYWNEGKPYTAYGNVFCDFEFTRSRNGTAGDYSYIGIYGWSRNPLIEYYIVEDWFGSGIIGPSTMGGGAKKMGEFEVDGATYFLYQGTRPAGAGNIEGSKTAFLQYFSVRQERRQSGTISITEHFKAWENAGMKLGTNMYEAKFLVEAGSGKGWFDASHLTFYKKD